jgi:hypothetical protein
MLFWNKIWCVFLQYLCPDSIHSRIAWTAALDFAKRTRGKKKQISCIARAFRLSCDGPAADAVALPRQTA